MDCARKTTQNGINKGMFCNCASVYYHCAIQLKEVRFERQYFKKWALQILIEFFIVVRICILK